MSVWWQKQIIEVAPLAYMRGRTLDDSFIILDEAQNTTPEQMKMFLTRMGVGSKVVVTGDVTQIDLPDRTRSGLVDALQVLKGVNGIAQCYFTEKRRGASPSGAGDHQSLRGRCPPGEALKKTTPAAYHRTQGHSFNKNVETKERTIYVQ